MRNTKKALLLSALCVAMAILLLGYSAYGWFNMNREVRAVAQNINITAPSNLLISLSGTDGWSDNVTVDMDTIISYTTAGDGTKFTGDAGQRYFLLPASSYSGADNTFWQTGSANSIGAATSNIFYSGNRIKWNPSTNSFEGHWVDVQLYFKTNAKSNIPVALSKYQTVITPDTKDINKAVRVAFLSEDTENENSLTLNSNGEDAGNNPFVYTKSTSEGVHEGVVITGPDYSNEENKKTPKYISFETDDLSNTLFTVNPGTVKKITLRIWVEGQDQSCIAKIGGQEFQVKLGFAIKENA